HLRRSKMEKVPVSMHKDAKFESVRLYLVERKMGSSRRAFLTQLARSKGFIVEDILSDVVTHIVSEDCQASSLWTWLEGHGVKTLPMMQVLDITWFTDSMKQGKPVAVEPRHLIQEILQCGFSMEVQKILSNERFKTLKLFMSVFGVGLKTAEKWYRKGLLSFTRGLFPTGFLHYGDISRAVSKAEAQALGNIIDETVHAITSDALLTLTGGFRRYKTCLLLSVFILKMKEYSTLFCLLSIVKSILVMYKDRGILRGMFGSLRLFPHC
uniref:BRCT domain-containing protein n=1 Tax=Gouania willdenowi TaxID=441366 RepID=A0A8C5EAJ7_GOUWI